MDLRRAGAVALTVFSYIARVCAILLGLLTVLLCFPGVAVRLNIMGLVMDLTQALPDVIAGYGLITSPFGGVFRFDFALAMVFLLVVDYAAQRAGATFCTSSPRPRRSSWASWSMRAPTR